MRRKILSWANIRSSYKWGNQAIFFFYQFCRAVECKYTFSVTICKVIKDLLMSSLYCLNNNVDFQSFFTICTVKDVFVFLPIHICSTWQILRLNSPLPRKTFGLRLQVEWRKLVENYIFLKNRFFKLITFTETV